MKNIIGMAMVATPFVVLFVLVTITLGIVEAVAIYGLVVFLVAWIAIGLRLVAGHRQQKQRKQPANASGVEG